MSDKVKNTFSYSSAGQPRLKNSLQTQAYEQGSKHVTFAFGREGDFQIILLRFSLLLYLQDLCIYKPLLQ